MARARHWFAILVLLQVVFLSCLVSGQITVLGGYTMTKDPSVDKYCASMDVPNLKFQSQQGKPERNSILISFYSQVNTPLINFLQHKDYIRFLKEGWLPFFLLVLLPIIGLALSLSFIPVASIWIASFFCAKKKGQEDDEPQFQKRCDPWKVTTDYCTGTLLFFTFVCSALWLIDSIYLVLSLKTVSCSAAVSLSDIIEGTNTKDAFWPGIKGLDYLLKSMDKTFPTVIANSNATIKANYIAKTGYVTSTIVPSLPNTADSLESAMNDVTNNYYRVDAIHCGKPGVVTQLKLSADMEKPYISPTIRNETIDLMSMSRALHTSCQMINSFLQGTSTSTTQPILDAIKSFISIAADINTQSGNLRTQIMNNFDFDKTYYVAILVIVLISFSLALILISYIAFWCVNVYYKTVNLLIHISKIIMICTLAIGCIASIIALVTVIISAVMFNGCELFDKALDDPTSMKSFQLGSMIDKLTDVCLYKNSTGDMITILDTANSQAFTDAQRLVGGFTNTSRLTVFNTTTNDKLSINQYNVLLNSSYLLFLPTAPYVDSTSDLTTNVNQASDLIKGTFKDNLMGLLETQDPCRSKPKYVKDPDPPAQDNGNSACVILPQFSLADYSQRYPIPMFGTQNISFINNVKQCQLNYSNYIGGLNNKSFVAVNHTNTLRNSLGEAFTQTQDIRFAFNETRQFIEASPINSSFSTLFNCRILRQEFLLLRFAVCGTFTDRFAGQSFWLSLLGPIMAALGVSMCCQLRMVERDKNKLPAHMMKDAKPILEINELLL
jgi:hypothetical protein